MPRPISRTSLVKKLDSLWGLAVKLRVGSRCEVCGQRGLLSGHHIVGRRNLRLRWELYNGVCLCAGCHTFKTQSAHQSPVWFQEELSKLNSTSNENRV